MSSNLLTLSCNLIGTLHTRYFLKIASGFRGICGGEFIFQHRIYMLRKPLDFYVVAQLVVQNLFV